MVKVNQNTGGDRWSLISLGNSRGRGVELKFVDCMRRQFEFSVDSFQIILDSLLLFYKCSELPISENFYPTVVGESVYGDFQEALYHLQKKLISTRYPEEIRGGGLLKYCNLLVKNYKPARPDYIKRLQRWVLSQSYLYLMFVIKVEHENQTFVCVFLWGSATETTKKYLIILTFTHVHVI